VSSGSGSAPAQPAARRADWTKALLATVRRLSGDVRTELTDRALGAWFLLMDIVWVAAGATSLEAFGTDANLYRFAAAQYLAGGDPWTLGASSSSFAFSGLPPTILAFVPFALMPTPVVESLWVGASLVAAVFVLRQLGLPLWWLSFPPLAAAIWSGNPHTVLLALLLSRWSALAPVLKLYAVVPLALLGRWRPLVVAGALFALSVVLAPGLWADYLRNAGAISARLLYQAQGDSAFAYPILEIGAAALILVVFSRREIAWLAVPALWPGAEAFYRTMALPVISPLMAGILALPLRGSAVLAVAAIGGVRLLERRARN
jgi:hypothetical protein